MSDCIKCNKRPAQSGVAFCGYCSNYHYHQRRVPIPDQTFREFKQAELEGESDLIALLRADDELMTYHCYKEYGNFIPNLMLEEYPKLENWFSSKFLKILKERIAVETGYQGDMYDKELRRNFVNFRRFVNCLYSDKNIRQDYPMLTNYHPAMLLIMKILRGKFNIDPYFIKNIGEQFEPGSAFFFLELYTRLMNINVNVLEEILGIENLVEEMDRVSIMKKIQEPLVLLTPWEHQQRAFDSWKKSGYNGILEMATATGKTLVGFMAIEHYADIFKTGDIRIIAHSKAILNQWRREAIEKLGLIANLNDDYTTPISANKIRIFFNTIQSIYKTPREFRSDFLIVDEVHHSASLKFRNALKVHNCRWKMGLSATVEGTMRQEVLKAHLGTIVYQFSLKEALEKKVLPRFDWKLHMVNLSIEEEQEFTSISNTIRRLFMEVSMDEQVIFSISNDHNNVMENLYDFVRLVERARYRGIRLPANWITLQNLLYQRRWIIHRSHPKLDHAVQLARSLCNEKKAIMFTMDIQTCEDIYRKLKHDIDNLFMIHSNIKEDPNKLIIRFKEVDTGLLIGAKMLDEGIDVPDAEIGINVSSSKTKLQLIQRLGRILRKGEGKHPIFHQYISVPTQEAYVNEGDDISLLDNISWVQDIALGMGMKITIEPCTEYLETVKSRAEKSVRDRYKKKLDIGYVPGYGTMKLNSLLNQFPEDALNSLKTTLRDMDQHHIITDSEWSRILQSAFNKDEEESLNIPGYWWILLIGDRNPEKVRDIISRKGNS